jgi:hypothetical protein
MLRSRPERAVHAAVGVAFVLSVSLGVHGFSLPLWHGIIDQSQPREILAGTAQPILSDTWIVYLPMILSQRHSPTPYSTVSPVIGDPGQSMLTSFAVPVLHVLTLFRPHLWGYFLGDNPGLAWHWAFFTLITFQAFFLLCRVVGRAPVGFSLALGSAAALAPFFQLWGMVDSPFATYAALSAVCLWKAFAAPGVPRAVAWGAGAGYFATCLVFLMYPPYAVTLAYWVLFVVLGAALESAGGANLGLRRVLALVTCAVIPAVMLALFLQREAGNLSILANTVYPGTRVLTGGGLPLLHEVSSWFLLAPTRIRDWGHLGNVCEASSYLLLTPVIVGVVLLRRARGEPVDPLVTAMLAYIGLVVAWQTIGFPLTVARLSLWSKVPETRAIIGLGPAEIVLLCRLFANRRATVERWPALLGLGAVLALAGLGAGHLLARTLVPLNPGRIAFGGIAFALVATVFLGAPRVAPWCLAAVSAALSLGFNPLVLRGARYLQENPLARAMKRAEATDPGAHWLVMNEPALANYPRMLGIHALNGVHFYPQRELWEALDPRREHVEAYNRYAYVNVWLGRGALSVRSPQPDVVNVTLDPGSEEFRRLGVRYVLMRGGPADFGSAFPGATLEYDHSGIRLLRLAPPEPDRGRR